jgi:predicted  nucleic acid-binding Zn-ribbon protein
MCLNLIEKFIMSNALENEVKELKATIKKMIERSNEKCEFMIDEEDGGWFAATCKASFDIKGITPGENEFAYCPNCGRLAVPMDGDEPIEDDEE